jgi:hypothetical protein
MKGIAIVAFIAAACGAQEFSFVKFAAEREGKVVTGAPYTAQAVTETTQVLADGNRIIRKSSSLIARDGQGRTRREQNLNIVGPWSASSPETSSTVFINDPVSGARYTLEGNSHAAVKIPIGPAEQGARQELEARLKADRRKLEAEGNNAMVRTESHVMVFTSDTPGMQIVTSSMESRNPPKTESLGTQIIEGVSAEGKRMTETIAAGKVGNERAIEVVNETWYSAELQTVVKSRHSDPRTGDVVYSLTNISRAEPDPTLFQVPADYKVREDGSGGNVMYKVRRPD